MRRRESFVHRSRNLLPIRAILDFPIPHCSKCKAQMVRFRVRWACKTCTNVDMVSFENEFVPTVDGVSIQTVPKVKPTPLGEAYPNRAARRRG